MSEFRIIYANLDGGLSVIIPAPGFTLEQVLPNVPEGADFEVVDVEDIPEDKTFRNAWEMGASRRPSVNIDKARQIKITQIRYQRTPILESLDVEFMRAVEQGDTAKQAEIASRKQALRDATKDPAILNATTVEELKAAVPAAMSA